MFLFGCGPEKVVRVNGHILTRQDYDREITRIIQQFASMGQALTGSQLRDVENDILDNLVETVLIYQHSLKAGVVAAEEEIQEEFDSIKNQFPTESDFKEALENQYHTAKSLREQVKRDLTVNQYIETEILADLSVEDSELLDYYDINKSEFVSSHRVRASHILVLVDAEADQITKQIAIEKLENVKKELAAGEGFSELAKTYSEGPTGPYGGDLGFFGRGQTDPSFEDAAFTLQIGEVSDIVESEYGYHLITVTDVLPAGVILFSDIKEVLKENLLGEKNRSAVEEFVESLRSSAQIEMFDGE